MRVVGYLHITTPPENLRLAFVGGLGEAGFAEGRNVAIVFRFADGQPGTLARLAAELAERGVEVIVTSGGSLSAQAAKDVTPVRPIVFLMGDADPVQSKFVASMNRPGGNLTGVTMLGGALGSKRVEILREIVPDAKAIAVLINPQNPNSAPYAVEVETAIRATGCRPVILPTATADELEKSFALIVEQKAEALIVTADNIFTRAARQLIALAARHRIPVIYQWRDLVVAGGLMSYGASLADANRQIGLYAGRILKGEKPADLPVTQPTKFDLVINQKTAKALGLLVPPTLLARADEVIE